MQELPDEVFTELGRFTLAAIELEDLTDALCANIRPANLREDRRPIGRKIRDARMALSEWSVDPRAAEAVLWLDRAAAALGRRNALLHAVPLEIWRDGQPALYALGEFARDGDYFERHLTVAGIKDVREELTAAHEGWRELIVAVYVMKHPNRRLNEGDQLIP